MAKDTEIKERFIELRAKGKSYEMISKELGVSKRTLIMWSRKFEFEIWNLKQTEIESLLDQYLLSKEKKLEMFKELLEKVKKNFLERDLNDLDTEKLFELILKLSDLLENGIRFKEKSVESDNDIFKTSEVIKTWFG